MLLIIVFEYNVEALAVHNSFNRFYIESRVRFDTFNVSILKIIGCVYQFDFYIMKIIFLCIKLFIVEFLCYEKW